MKRKPALGDVSFQLFKDFLSYAVLDDKHEGYLQYLNKSNYYSKDGYHFFDKSYAEVKSNKVFDDPVEYKLNNFAFRSDQFKKEHDGTHVIFSGCSETFGEGGPIEENWSYRVYSKLLENNNLSGYFNLARPGATWEDIMLNINKYINEYSKPDIIIMLLPNMPRNYSYYEDEGIWKVNFDWIANRKDKEYFNIYSSLFVTKMVSLNNFILFCNSIGIKIVWSTWSIPENEDIVRTDLFQKSFLKLYKIEFNDNIEYDADKYDVFRRDKIHRGNFFHKYIADEFLKYLSNNNILNGPKNLYDPPVRPILDGDFSRSL